jgi:hypothetical protein
MPVPVPVSRRRRNPFTRQIRRRRGARRTVGSAAELH